MTESSNGKINHLGYEYKQKNRFRNVHDIRKPVFISYTVTSHIQLLSSHEQLSL